MNDFQAELILGAKNCEVSRVKSSRKFGKTARHGKRVSDLFPKIKKWLEVKWEEEIKRF